MQFSDEDLFNGVRGGDLRAVSRLITLSENRIGRAKTIQRRIFPHTGNAHIIGVTGAPGAGKSTLVDHLAMQLRLRGTKVAILAIDPTSPFSGGAVLGDRIRMTKASECEDVFIRSMATRGSLGGISRATLDAVQILDAAGFQTVIIETVGVGQAEVDIVRLADTCLVVLVPGMGDSVQAIKAGILEIADLFVINKSDRDGTDHLHKDLQVLLSLSEYTSKDWQPAILRTTATEGKGISSVLDSVQAHLEWLRTSPEGKIRKLRLLRELIVKVASDLALERMLSLDPHDLDQRITECYERKTDPYTVVDELVKRISFSDPK